MAGRTQVQDMQPDVLLRPVASPTETFIKPPAQTDAGANLRDLAQGLAKFDSGLNDYFQEKAAQQSKDDALLAEADFHKQNGKGYAQGVAEGTIPAFASKAYMETYKGLEGQQAGRVLEQKFWSDYNAWDGKNSEDPAAFQTFYNGWLKGNVSDTQDPKVLAGLLPRLRGLSEQATNKWIGDKDAATKKGMADVAGAAAGNAMKDARTQALTTGKSIDYDGTFAKLDTLRTTLGSNGRSDAENDKTMIDTVTAIALEQKDPRWLGYLDRKIPGKDYGLADTPYGRQNKQQTMDGLDVLHRRNVSEAHTEKTRQDAIIKDDATRKAINWMLDNPNKPIPDDILAQGDKVDGSFKKDVLQWGEQLRSAKRGANTDSVAEVSRAIINGGGMRAFKGAMDHGVFAGDPDGMRSAYKLAEDVDKAGSSFGDIMKSSAANDIMGTIKQRTFSKDDLSQPFAPEGLSDTGLAAQYDFKSMVLQWAVQNPEAAKDPIKMNEAIAKIGKLVTDRLGREAEGTGSATYNRTGMEPLPNPFRPQDLPKPPPVAAPQAAAPQSQDPMAGSNGQAPGPNEAPPPAPAAPTFTPGKVVDNPDGSKTLMLEDKGQRFVQKFDPKAGWQQPQPYKEAANVLPPGDGGQAGGAAGQRGTVPPAAQGAAQGAGGQGAPTPPAEPAGPLTQALGDAGRQVIYGGTTGEAQPGSLAANAQQASTEVQAGVAQAISSPEAFMDWMKGGGDQPPANQTSGVGALMKSIGIENPQGFMSWLGSNLGVGGAKAAEVPAQVASAAQPAPQAPVPVSNAPEPPPRQGGYGPNNVYGNIPIKDTRGEDQVQKFLEWNPDPVGNSEANLKSVKGPLQSVFRKAMDDNPDLHIVVGAGVRSQADQEKAVKWGWSKTLESEHADGSAMDVWVLDKNGRVTFDKAALDAAGAAVKKAASDMGVKVQWGGDFKGSFKDRPHFELVDKNAADPGYTPKVAVPEGTKPLIDPSTVDTKKWAKFDENATANPELAKAVSAAMRDAINNPTYKPKGVFTLSTLKDDPVANRLLDFISGPESAGNYNAVWGNAKNKEDLSKFSVAQILQRQAATVNSGGQSATGRYQFIRKTLAGLVDEMGIDPNTKFTPELQDTMALHLLNRRGLDRYRSGQMSLEQFGNSLAQEWASLPNLTTYTTKDGKVRREGASAYAGDGLNKAHVSTNSIRDVLDLRKTKM